LALAGHLQRQHSQCLLAGQGFYNGALDTLMVGYVMLLTQKNGVSGQ